MSNPTANIPFIIAAFAAIIFMKIDILNLEKELSKLNSRIPERRLVTFKEAKQRANFIDWQIRELGMQCGDAISIANAAYDKIDPSVTYDNRYSTTQIDSLRKRTKLKAYMRNWTIDQKIKDEQ